MPHSLAAWTLPSWTALDYANHLWESTVVAFVLLVVLTLCARLSARTRAAILWLALGKFALPLAVVFALCAQLFFGSPSPQAAPPLAPPSASAHAGATTLDPAATKPGPSLFPLVIPLPASAGSTFLVVWLTGLTFCASLWSVRAFRARTLLLSGAAPLPPSVQPEIDVAVALAGLPSSPRCFATDSTHGPALVGLFSPVIVLPRRLITHLSSAELQAIFLHEFVHLRRRDHLWSVLQSLWVGLLWFHPVVWLLGRRLRLETEKACDERVLELTRDPETYASSIVKTVRLTLGLEGPGVSGATTPPVLSRLRAILAPRPLRRPYWLHLLAFGVALNLVVVGARAGASLARVVAAEPSFAPTEMPAPAPSPVPLDPLALGGLPAITLLASPALAPSFTGAPAPDPLAASAPTAGKKSPDDETLSIDFRDTEIREVLSNLADLYQINLVMPESLKGKTTVKLENVTWRQVFKAVLEPKGYTFVKDGNIIRIIPLAPAPQSGPAPRSTLDTSSLRPTTSGTHFIEQNGTLIPTYVLRPGDLLRLQVFQHPELSLPDLRLSADSTIDLPLVGTVSLSNKDVRESETLIREQLTARGIDRPQVNVSVLEYGPKYSPKETFSFDFQDTDTRAVLRRLANDFKLDVVVPPSVQGRTTLQLRNATLENILHSVLAPIGYTFVKSGNRVTIFAVPPARDGSNGR